MGGHKGMQTTCFTSCRDGILFWGEGPILCISLAPTALIICLPIFMHITDFRALLPWHILHPYHYADMSLTWAFPIFLFSPFSFSPSPVYAPPPPPPSSHTACYVPGLQTITAQSSFFSSFSFDLFSSSSSSSFPSASFSPLPPPPCMYCYLHPPPSPYLYFLSTSTWFIFPLFHFHNPYFGGCTGFTI